MTNVHFESGRTYLFRADVESPECSLPSIREMKTGQIPAQDPMKAMLMDSHLTKSLVTAATPKFQEEARRNGIPAGAKCRLVLISTGGHDSTPVEELRKLPVLQTVTVFEV